MIAYGRIAMFVGAVAVGVAIPVLYPILGWLPTTIVLALISFVALAPISRVAKERYRYTATHTLTPKEIIKSVTKNKYLFIFCIAYLIANAFNATMAVGSYFAIYCMGSTKLYSVIMLTSMLPLFFVAVILPALIKKFDKYVLTMWATGLSILMTVVLFLCGYTNHTLFYIMYAIRGTFLSFSTLTFAMFIIDCSEYGWYMTGENTTAVTVSLQTFTSKLSIALSGSIGMFILGVSGFISGTNAVQPSSVNNSLWFMMSVLPAVGQIIAFIILLFGYRLRDRDVQIMSKVNHGEITREEAQALISKKF
jgi:glycoside/pentoside/hexuronide:cation symporter, GPH family